MTDVLWLVLGFTALQAADVWSTWAVLSSGGREMNPLMARLFNRYGFWPSVLVVKGAAVLLIVYCRDELWSWEFLAVSGAYVVVVCNNLFAYLRLRRRRSSQHL